MVITTAKLHSTKPELRFCAGSSPAGGVSKIRDDEDLWQWSWLEMMLHTFRQSTYHKNNSSSSSLSSLSFASSIETNQFNALSDRKYLHNIISDLQNVIKSKDQIINLSRNDMKTLQQQLNVNENNTWKSLSSILVIKIIYMNLVRWFQIYIHLTMMIQQRMTFKMSLITVLPTTQIIHRGRKDERNRGE